MIPYPAEKKWRTLHFTWIAFWSTFFAWFAFAPLAVAAQKELSLTNAQLGWLAMAGQLLTIPGRLFVGGLVDRIGPRRTFTVLMLLVSVPVALLGFARSFHELLGLRLLIGLAGCGFVVGVRMIADWFPPRQLGLAEGIYGGWGNCGAGFAALLLPLAAHWIGWRFALASAAIPLVLWSWVFWRNVSDVPAGRVFRRTPREQNFSAWRDRDARLLAFAYLATFGTEISIVTFLPKYFYDRFHITLLQAGWCASVFAILNIIARPAGGWLADRCGRKRVLLITLAGSAVTYAAMGFAPSLALAIAATAVAALFVQAGCGAVYAIVPLVHPTAVGQVAGFVGATANAGALVFPLVFGYGLQLTGGSYAPAFIAVAATALVAFLALTRLRITDAAHIQDASLQQDFSRVTMRLQVSGQPRLFHQNSTSAGVSS
ncbi:MAG: MFS transporter [Candidatus Sumerlaeaceae bacterium]